MRYAVHPNLRWDEPLASLWLQLMVLARPNWGDRTNSGHLIRKTAAYSAPCGTTGQVVQPSLVCWEYNLKGACFFKETV